jgi:hypothetical protein
MNENSFISLTTVQKVINLLYFPLTLDGIS